MQRAVPAQMQGYRDAAIGAPLPKLLVLRLLWNERQYAVPDFVDQIEEALKKVRAVADIGEHYAAERTRRPVRVEVPSTPAEGPDVAMESRLALIDESPDGREFVMWLDEPDLIADATRRARALPGGIQTVHANSYQAFLEDWA